MTAVPRLAGRVGAEVVVLDAEASADSVAAETVVIMKSDRSTSDAMAGSTAETRPRDPRVSGDQLTVGGLSALRR